jgi:hypothetical protein
MPIDHVSGLDAARGRVSLLVNGGTREMRARAFFSQRIIPVGEPRFLHVALGGVPDVVP